MSGTSFQNFDQDFDLLTLRENDTPGDRQEEQVIALLNSHTQQKNAAHARGRDPARQIAKYRQKLKFYEQIQQMIEIKLEEDRSNFFNEDARTKLARLQSIERSISQISIKAKENAKLQV